MGKFGVLRKMFMFIVCAGVLLWNVFVEPLTGEASVSNITVTKASAMQPEFLAMVQEQNGVDRVRLDDSKEAIPKDPNQYSIFRYTVLVTNPSFKDARDIDFRIEPLEGAAGRFLVMNLNPVNVRVYSHETTPLSFNALVNTHGLTQQQIEELKDKIQLEVTWREGFWVRSSNVRFVD